MGLVLKYIISIVFSFLLSSLSVCYRWNYLERAKKTFKEIIKLQTKVLGLFVLSYTVLAALAITFQAKKGYDNFTLVQLILLWDGLFCIAFIDYQTKKIPNKLLICVLLIRIIFIIVKGILNFKSFIPLILSSLLGMFVGGFIVLACMLISRGGVGAGDIKLFAIIGFYFGLSGIIAVMMYSLFLAAIFSIIMLVSKKAKLKTTMPMAPFILMGLSVYYLFL